MDSATDLFRAVISDIERGATPDPDDLQDAYIQAVVLLRRLRARQEALDSAAKPLDEVRDFERRRVRQELAECQERIRVLQEASLLPSGGAEQRPDYVRVYENMRKLLVQRRLEAEDVSRIGAGSTEGRG